jgi:hypothetical protein
MRALPARYVPPSGFGYPRDGLLPSNPCRFYFAPAALVGLTLRSFPPLKRYAKAFPPWKNPHTVSPVGIPWAEARGRLDRPRFLGCDPFESPWPSGACLVHGSLAAPLGLTLLRCSIEGLDRDFARSPLARFSGRTYARPPASQSFDRPSPRPHPALRQAARVRMRQPL